MHYNGNALCLSTLLLGKLIAKDGDSTMRVKKELNIQIGERIKQAREQAKLTQEQLAERIDVSPQYVSDLERGVVGVSVATLKRICTSLGIASDQILFGSVSQSRSVAIEEKCRSLTDRQFLLLLDICESYVAAIDSAHTNA